MPPVSVVGGFGAIEVGNEVVLLQRCTQQKYKESTVQRLSPVPARSVRGSLRADVTDVVLVESGETAPTQLDESQVEADDVSMDAHGPNWKVLRRLLRLPSVLMRILAQPPRASPSWQW